jgi:hypothetical protein
MYYKYFLLVCGLLFFIFLKMSFEKPTLCILMQSNFFYALHFIFLLTPRNLRLLRCHRDVLIFPTNFSILALIVKSVLHP